MRHLPKAPFVGGLTAGLAVALAVTALLVYTAASTTSPRAASPGPSAATGDRVDTDALIAAQPVPPAASAPPSGAPEHGPLLFDVSSMVSSGNGQLPVMVGHPQLDKVKVVDRGIQFEVSTASRAMVPLPDAVQPSSFVAVMKVDLVSGAGAFTFAFHMDKLADQQHAVQVYTTGTTEAVLFDGAAGTRSLFRPVNKVPALAGSAALAIAVDGPAMRIYVNGVEAGTAQDGTLSRGSMGFKAGAAARDDPFVMRLTDLKIYQPASAD